MLEGQHDVTNIISVDNKGDLYLSFVFNTDIPEAPGGLKAQEIVDMIGQKAAEKTLEVIRQMVVDGEVLF